MRLPRSWLAAVVERSDLRALIRRNMALSAGINALFSLGFFRAVFGLSGRPLTWGVPDRLSLDFLPQAGMVALMSALVPPLVERRGVGPAGAAGPGDCWRRAWLRAGGPRGGCVPGRAEFPCGRLYRRGRRTGAQACLRRHARRDHHRIRSAATLSARPKS